MSEHPDLTRLRREYAAREERLAASDLYSPFNPAYLFAIQQRQRNMLRLLKQAGILSVKQKRILEIGCGSGGVLQEFLGFGAEAAHLHGIDLLHARLRQALGRFSALPVACADGQFLPYPSQTFDLVLQFTAFSSILNEEVKQHIAQEKIRVLRSNEVILWYDFWLNPQNPQTQGIRPKEICALFPSCTYLFCRITLAPPLARRLVPVPWVAAEVLEKTTLFNSHYLVAIRP